MAEDIAVSKLSTVQGTPRESDCDSTSEGVPNHIGIEAGTGSSGASCIGLMPDDRSASINLYASW